MGGESTAVEVDGEKEMGTKKKEKTQRKEEGEDRRNDITFVQKI